MKRAPDPPVRGGTGRFSGAGRVQPTVPVPQLPRSVRHPRIGAPVALALGAWPDGNVTLAALSAGGVFLSQSADLADDGAWRRIAEPQAALSRGLALTMTGHRARLAWSDTDGVHVSTLLRSGSARAGEVSVGPPRTVSVPEHLQPRFPLAAVAGDAETLDLFWSVDQVRLFRTTAHTADLGARQLLELAPACLPGERLRALTACRTGQKAGWLAGVTDRGRVLAAHWDLVYDLHGPWHVLEVPITGVVSIAVVRVQNRPMAIVAGPRGELLNANLELAVSARSAWHWLEPPAGVPTGRITAIRAEPGPNGPWLAAATADRIWLTVLRDHVKWLACGPVIDIPLAPVTA